MISLSTFHSTDFTVFFQVRGEFDEEGFDLILTPEKASPQKILEQAIQHKLYAIYGGPVIQYENGFWNASKGISGHGYRFAIDYPRLTIGLVDAVLELLEQKKENVYFVFTDQSSAEAAVEPGDRISLVDYGPSFRKTGVYRFPKVSFPTGRLLEGLSAMTTAYLSFALALKQCSDEYFKTAEKRTAKHEAEFLKSVAFDAWQDANQRLQQLKANYRSI